MRRDCQMTAFTTHLGDNGRLVIPATLRRELGLQPGDELVLVLEEDGLRILTRDQAVRAARKLVRRYASGDRSLVGELVEERRAEAAGE
jgi:AbrB family looped-hinge helix DNA binding protein